MAIKLTKPVSLTPTGGSAGALSGASSAVATVATQNKIKQVVGLVPLVYCDDVECRDNYPQNECYFIPAFGNVSSPGSPDLTPNYFNDFAPFLVDYPIPNASYVIKWSLERVDNINFYTPTVMQNWVWEKVTDLDYTNANGICYASGSIPSHPTYNGYAVNWGQVVDNYGPGIYRVKCTVTKTLLNITWGPWGTVTVTQTNSIDECVVSYPFHVRKWNCDLAHGTVKFETWATGNQGSIDEPLKLFDLCNIEWYDSTRIKGIFGFEKTKYDELILEYDTGQLEKVRDKAMQGFVLETNYLPKWVHDRIKSYGLMADTVLVSDYNLNNSDYSIKRKGVMKSGAYEPTYLDGKRFDKSLRSRQRTSKVSVQFRENTESVIKNICCIVKC